MHVYTDIHIQVNIHSGGEGMWNVSFFFFFSCGRVVRCLNNGLPINVSEFVEKPQTHVKYEVVVSVSVRSI